MMKDLLNGVRVVTTAVNAPGPIAAARLVSFGAAVTKVEPPAGDPMHTYSPDWYTQLVNGQRCVRLDLKDGAGRAALDDLLVEADLLLTSIRPRTLRRLALNREHLRRCFPRLSQVAIVGFPAPRENEAGHDLTYQAEQGLVRPPYLPATLLADLAAAERAVSTGLALLHNAARRGVGGYAEVAMSEAVDGFVAPLRHGLTAPGALLGGGEPGYNIYRARKGWVAVAALEPHFTEQLRTALELDVLSSEALQRAFVKQDAAHWEKWARARDLPLVEVVDIHF
jgi:crotonobetainyl-CoA:carnitine CoA-transferase CaiB-like acyl-CoA transferase